MRESTDQNEHETKTEICKVCGDKAIGYSYGFLICNPCRFFLIRYLKYQKRHKPCLKKQQCVITIRSRSQCFCCRLKKCLALGMDPYYKLRRHISYTCEMNVPKGISPFPQCSTCSSTVPKVDSAPNTNNPFATDLLKSESNRSSPESPSTSQAEFCEVCGDRAYRRRYAVLSCAACDTFFKMTVKYKRTHKPCTRNQQCIITPLIRETCPCCRLKKCLAVGMYPGFVTREAEIDREDILGNEPKEWIFLLPCHTCDLTKIQAINSYIEELQSFFTRLREHREFSALPSVNARDETVQGESRKIDNAGHLDSSKKPFRAILIPHSSLRDTSVNYSEPTISAENDLQSATSNCRYVSDSITVKEETIQGDIETYNTSNLESTDYTELGHFIFNPDSSLRGTNVNHGEPTISAENEL